MDQLQACRKQVRDCGEERVNFGAEGLASLAKKLGLAEHFLWVIGLTFHSPVEMTPAALLISTLPARMQQETSRDQVTIIYLASHVRCNGQIRQTTSILSCSAVPGISCSYQHTEEHHTYGLLFPASEKCRVCSDRTLRDSSLLFRRPRTRVSAPKSDGRSTRFYRRFPARQPRLAGAS
jgi:hypothetical protein